MNLNSVKVTVQKEEGRLLVECPYSPAFYAAATVIGGRGTKFGPGQKSVWSFELGREASVRKALADIYGTDGGPEPPETTTVKIVISPLIAAQTSLWLGGWLIAARDQFNGRLFLDPAAKVVGGPGLPPFLEAKLFPPLGGEGTVLEIEAFPRPLAERLGLTEGPAAPRYDGPAALGVAIAELRARLYELGDILRGYPDSQVKWLADQQVTIIAHQLDHLRELVKIL